jgi:hypothetical protein
MRTDETGAARYQNVLHAEYFMPATACPYYFVA